MGYPIAEWQDMDGELVAVSETRERPKDARHRKAGTSSLSTHTSWSSTRRCTRPPGQNASRSAVH